jgi:Antibiotic biosynthesis monooxygenase
MTSDSPSTARRGTMVVLMTVDAGRGEEVDRHFRDDVRPWAQSQPGFVSAQWLRLASGDRGMGLVTFETEDQAQAASQGPRSQPRVDGRPWNTDAVEVYAVVTQA